MATLYLRATPEAVAPLVLLTGDPARVDRIDARLDGARIVSRNREYTLATGRYQDTPISALSAGIGAPSTAIALEELAGVGARAVVRVGTMMGVEAAMGSAVLATGAARFEGTSAAYLPLPCPAVPDWALARSVLAAATAAGLDVRTGISATYDAFYPAMAPTLVGGQPLDLAPLRAAGVLALDMETALVYIAGARLRLAVVALCLVTVRAEPFAQLAPNARAAGEDRLVGAALDGLVAFDRMTR
jgi:uridine phosphorylase